MKFMETEDNQDFLNQDAQELAKFEKLAARWWDPHSEFKPLHQINPLRAGWIDTKLNVAGLELLDVGCGGGLLCEAMAQRGALVTGIDLGEAPLAVAKLHSLESGLKINYQKIATEIFATTNNERFDIITCLEMIEHVPDPASIITACAVMLKPGGHLFCSTINRNPKAWLFAVVGAEYLLHLLPKGTHDYSKFIKPSELAKIARHCSLELQEVKGMTYNPFTKVYSLGSDVDVNYLMHYTKPTHD
jgi:2-polyprenyl-6-hydroxyphenyl methylase/3-demethylubiquinone-9 3-methyltransferase